MKLYPFPFLAACSTMVLCAALVPNAAGAEQKQIVLVRGPSNVVLEAFAPNIIRVTVSLLKDEALAAPGYGFTARPSPQSWTHQHLANEDIYQSPRVMVSVTADRKPSLTPAQKDIARFFDSSVPPVHITISTSEGKKLLEMTDWAMSVPNHKDGNAKILYDRRPTDAPFYQVGSE